MIESGQIKKLHRVLVADDQELNRDILGMILEDYYDVIYAENGSQALELISENIDSLSIVMLDIFMPGMDGFEVLCRMKADEDMKDIPVIVLTSEKSAELKALELGAADFITKPFDIHEVILARVGRMIELSDGKRLISSAERDRLTLLYSRNFFLEYAGRLFESFPGKHFDAVAINIEQFHSINAINGRDFGDRMLRVIGDEVNAFLSGTEGIASRPEADRFHILCESLDDYRPLLDRLQKKVDSISPNVSIRLRMGVRKWDEGANPVLMLDQAHAACNMARGSFNKPLRIYDESIRQKETLDQRMINDLRAAIEERQLTVYYQPKYDIRVDPPRLTSAEALIRWRHPELGMISPGSFVPLFESKGLISAIDDFVWREAAAQISKWKERFGVALPVSVNLSRVDMFDSTLIGTLVGLVTENGLDFKDIKLEITESAYTNNAKKLLNIVDRLRDTGFEIEMDDFGSGYSSLNMLSAMPIDVLKMDMRFIRDIETNETDRMMVTLILDIAKYLDVPVVAEGVETQGQLDMLRGAGCDLVQGYYFSRPLPPDEFEKLMEKELCAPA